MITFKPFSPAKPNVWQAYINKEPMGLLVEGETAKEAEQKFVALATNGLRWDIDKERFEKASKELFDLETAHSVLKHEHEKREAELQDVIDQRAELMKTIQKMKTEAPAKRRGLFGRRSNW